MGDPSTQGPPGISTALTVQDGQAGFTQSNLLEQGKHTYLPSSSGNHHYSPFPYHCSIIVFNDDAVDVTAEEEGGPAGFGQVNDHTSGTEFYGPTATLAFLLELRSRARILQSQISQMNVRPPQAGREPKGPRRLSIVNFFHSDDYVISGTKFLHFFIHLANPTLHRG